ncbi:PAS domain S-box protein [Halorubrum sp. DTA98]|uniref:PAS domain S-box protein n=1 Tax=Halorubrum sp. DTA98 TaxID=3402163 RepID=UPI003AAEFB98
MSPRTTEPSLPFDEAALSHADRFLLAVAVDGEVLFAGPSVPDVLGLDRSAFTGSDLLEYVHPNEREPIVDALSAVASHRRVTHRFRNASGGYTWVESVVDEDLAPEFGGRVLTARCVDVDRTFPERFREFLEYGTDIVTVVDADGRVRYESPSVEEVLGYEQGSLVGRSPLGYVHPKDRERVTEGFYRALDETNAAGSMEFRYRTADGDWVWLESRTRTLPDDAVAGRLVINSRDVTERKRRERRLVDRNERLDRFASIVSHDLRNPLSVVRASMEMAELKDDTEPLVRGRRAADRIDQLITELLTLARQGTGVDDPTEFTLAGVAHDAWETAGDAAADLTVREDARIYADRSRLRQALENLFRNCVEHGSTSNRAEPDDSVEHGSTGNRLAADETDRTPVVSVTVAATDGGFLVADDGPGIDPKHDERVFEPGFTTEDDGTGYGLDIVREIVDAHGWSIGTTRTAHDGWSEETSGARFEIRAPTPDEVDDEPWVSPSGTR